MTKRIFALVFVLLFALSFAACDSSDYEKAKTLYSKQKYEEALELFKGISTYEDSAKYIEKCEGIIAASAYICENPLYFRGDDDGLHRLIFSPNKEVNMECIIISDNRVYRGDTEVGIYTMDEVGITLILGEKSTIAYACFSEDDYVFTEGYYTLEDIGNGLLGNWSYTDEKGSAYEIELTEETISYVIKNGDKTEGPFEGSYKTGFGVFDTEVENGEIFSYNIDGGKITLRVFGNDCKKVYKLLSK